MNVSRIKTLSEQHEGLKKFYQVCNRPDATLSIEAPPGIVLNKQLCVPSTQLIIIQLRGAILDQIGDLERLISEEAAK